MTLAKSSILLTKNLLKEAFYTKTVHSLERNSKPCMPNFQTLKKFGFKCQLFGRLYSSKLVQYVFQFTQKMLGYWMSNHVCLLVS